ncbi:mitochondrial carrier domain-containing protein [Massariosphaeria phaeospora]|uniref:Mitochondrial carrier domain-containing protein n=1 Tax=Massariosphaeria phaeospora TaxID=100035 RepID=A0A7C8MGE1_9PLEO|nr:mitochondrial carrier domain-containing protein [Massariosphaeria phaeospora]
MSADFWAGYLSGAVGIIIGNPLDLVKTRLQAGNIASSPESGTASPSYGFRGHFDRAGTLVKGASAPILGYGALNAILFVTYNRALGLLSEDPSIPSHLFKVWCAGAAGGLATFVVSAPTELVKCRAQVSIGNSSSWSITKNIWRDEGIRGLYHGGGITSVRDAVGYGFYFWSYECSKRTLSSPDDTDRMRAVKVLLCGGLAGIVTWASIFPLDVVKTRVQTQHLHTLPAEGEQRALLQSRLQSTKIGALEIAKRAYQFEGIGVFFKGFGVCSVRAFVVNAVQWAVYEWMMRLLR